MKENNINWLCEWYSNNCDGDWEHQNGVVIETIDNPGWNIIINIKSNLGKIEDIPWIHYEVDVNDWMGYKIENKRFEASGDASKLNLLIGLFREFIEIGSISLPNSV